MFERRPPKASKTRAPAVKHSLSKITHTPTLGLVRSTLPWASRKHGVSSSWVRSTLPSGGARSTLPHPAPSHEEHTPVSRCSAEALWFFSHDHTCHPGKPSQGKNALEQTWNPSWGRSQP